MTHDDSAPPDIDTDARDVTVSATPAKQGTDVVTVFVCTTCRQPGTQGETLAERPGQRMHDSLKEAVRTHVNRQYIRVEPVECLSVCKRPATVAFTSADKWTYVYGDLNPELDARTLLDAATAYGGTDDGIVPWAERAAIVKRGVIARIPPGNINDRTDKDDK